MRGSLFKILIPLKITIATEFKKKCGAIKKSKIGKTKYTIRRS